MGNCLTSTKDVERPPGFHPIQREANHHNSSPARNGDPRFNNNNSGLNSAAGDRIRIDIIRQTSTTSGNSSSASPQTVQGGGGGGTPPRNSPMVVRALYNYERRVSTDISFKKGDRMEAVQEANSDPDWLKVRHLITGTTGFVPRNYVARETSVESQDWFFPRISRKEAETLLLMPQNPRGTFLIRPSERLQGQYSLSVQDWEPQRGKHIKHYKIRSLDNTGGCYIAPRTPFSSLTALVESYMVEANGLCHVLTQVCPRPKPQMWDLSPETRNHWMEIDKSEIKLKRLLGSGNFGEVWYGLWRDQIEVAVKKLKPGSMSPQAFLEEAQIMKTFRHERLIALYAVCSAEEPILIVTEYMSKGSLLDFLRGPEGKLLGFADLLYIATQVAGGMAYLEEKRLIHRDLAARNILIGENNEAKICDFGLARAVKDDEYCPKQGAKFPVKWTAPEAMMYGKFTIKSDVWSFGVLLMEIVTYGATPYPGLPNHQVLNLLQRGYRMPRPLAGDVTCPEPLYELMCSCWSYEPVDRPTFEFLEKHLEDFPCSTEVQYRNADLE